MSKKFKKSLQSLSADQVTEKLGDMCEQFSRIFTDKKKGTLRTSFRLVVAHRRGGFTALVDTAAEKNGIEYDKNADFYKPALAKIVSAAESRGSRSAAKIKESIQLEEKVKKAMSDNGITRSYVSTKDWKKFG